MNTRLKKIFKFSAISILGIVVVLFLLLFLLAQKEKPERIIYGMSFNTMYAEELGLDWMKTYDALLD